VSGTLLKIEGQAVLLLYPRRPWHLWKRGWHRHTDFYQRRCWIRYNWPKEVEDVR